MKKINGAVFSLWFTGYFIFLGSLAAFIFTFFREPCGKSISCQVEGLMYQSTGILGMFIGAVIVVFGFWKRSKDNNQEETLY